MKNSILNVWLVVFGLVIILWTNGLSASAPDTTDQVLRIVAAPYEPFVYEQKGQLAGFDVDVVKMICNMNHWRYHIHLTTFQDMLHQIDMDSADIAIGAIYKTDERVSRFQFSQSYLKTGLVLVSTSEKPLHSIADIAGKRIGVKANATGEVLARSLVSSQTRSFDIVRYTATDSSLEALSQGTIDGLFNDYINSQIQITRHYQGKLIIASGWFGPKFLTRVDLAYPIGKSFLPRLIVFNQALNRLESMGTMDELEQKWFIHPLGFDWQKMLMWGSVGLFLFLILLGIGFVIYRIHLKRRVSARSETYYKSIIENSSDIITLISKDGEIKYINDSAIRLLGYSSERLIKRNLFEIIPDGEAQQILDFYQKIKSRKGGVVSGTFDIFDRWYKARTLEVTGRIIRTEEGDDQLVINARDVTQRNEAEKEILLFKNAVESVNEAISITDMQDTFLFVNRAFSDLYGYNREELIGRNVSILRVPTNEQPDIKNILNETIRGGWSGEILNRKKDGTVFPIRLSTSIIRDDHDQPVALIGVAIDVTEENRLEEELQRAEKLESLGVLAGGIAHDFNNILTSVIGNLSLAKSYIGNPEKLAKLLDSAEQASTRATELTRRLLTFSKGGNPIREHIELETYLREILEFSLSGSNVNFVIRVDHDLNDVLADRNQLDQGFRNVIINADQSMPQGGTLTVSAQNVTTDDSQSVPGLEAGPYVRIDFQDEGVGINLDNLDKIFDPFYSTKKGGSGLGLATTYSIIKKHHGTIEVDSEIGKGTTFSIFLPAVSGQHHSDTTGISGNGQDTISGHVLVMDDEESVREVCGEMLHHLGLDVAYAANGREAIQQYKAAKENSRPFDLLIMDLTIPGGMGGMEAIQYLKEYDPGVKAIVSSGYSTNPAMAEYQNYGFQGVVNKPYQLEDLKKVVLKMLEN